MKKILFISLAVIMALSVGLIGCGGDGDGGNGGVTAPTEIVVGLARDLDQHLAYFECMAAGAVYRWYVNATNTAGGVHLSEYDTANTTCIVPIRTVVRDFDAVTMNIATITQQLIQTYKADFIWGGPGTACINPQASACNLLGTLLFTLEGGASDMITSGQIDNWPYVWISLTFSDWYQLPVLHAMLNQKLGRNSTAWVTYINDAHGQEYLAATRAVFGDANILPTGSPPGHTHGFFIDANDADDIVDAAAQALNDTGYDVFCAWTYPWNVDLIMSAIKSYNDPSLGKFDPPAIILGPGANFGKFGFDHGYSDVEGVMCFATANNKTQVNVGTATMSMATMFHNIAEWVENLWTDPTCPSCGGPLYKGNMTSGDQNYDYWGDAPYVASMEMWKYAVEAAGNLSAVAVRNALVSYNSTNPASTVFGNTWYRVFGGGYGGGLLDYKCETGQLGQWQNGVIEIVGFAGINTTGDPSAGCEALPNYWQTAPFVYPMNGTWGWL